MPVTVARKLSYYAIGFVGLYVLAEVGAFVIQSVVEGSPMSLRELADERDRIIETRAEETRLPDRSEAGRDSGKRVEILHPFMGYVVDYHDSLCSGHGFCDDLMRQYDDAPLTPGSEGDFVVAVFGGSFAYQTVHVSSEDYLEEALRSLPGLGDKRMVIHTIALGGFKQPQQLMALNWFLSLGAGFDLVINLDGFNEAALPPAENVSAGTHPFFPRVWHNRVRVTRNVALLGIYGRIEHAKDTRARRAKRLNESPWRYSVLRNLVWKARDVRMASRIAEYEAQARSYRAANTHVRGLVATGPPYDAGSGSAMFEDIAAQWARSSRQMHAVSAAHGIRYFHFLQPNQYHAGSKPLSEQERREAYIEGHPYRPGVLRTYPLLVRQGAELVRDGINFVDLSSVFAGNEQTLYVDACCHLGPEGYEIVIDAMVEAMRPHFSALP